MILCGDIGGTNTRLALASVQGGGVVRILSSWRVPGRDVGSLGAAVTQFLSRPPQQALLQANGGRVQAACLGVAGPVVGRRVQMTNLAWSVDGDELSQLLGGAPVSLVNDFQAAARGIEAIRPDDLLNVQAGADSARQGPAHQLVIGAGTGLGVAWRVWVGDRHLVVPGEGGHVGFSPLNEVQDKWLSRLRHRHGRVVAEHIVSGPGIVNLYECLLAEQGGLGEGGAGVSAQEVFKLATESQDPVALQAVDQFLLAYGAVAGAHALTLMARGGVFIAGGLAARWPDLMRNGRFLEGFRLIGPYAELLSTWPVQLVLNPDLGLLGSALEAADLL